MAIEVLTREPDYVRAQVEAPYGPDRSFDALLNNPGRALMYLVAASDPDKPHTPTTLVNTINKLQGTGQGWRLDMQTSGIPREYCSEVLAPSGLLLETTTAHSTQNRKILAYRASKTNLPFRIAVGAAGLDWELQFPHLKLADLLGTARLYRKESRPLISLKVYDALLHTPANNASLLDITEKTRVSSNAIDHCLKTLVERGIVTKSYADNAPSRARRYACFQIDSSLRAPIADLVLRYQNLQNNPKFVEAAVTRADEILGDPAAVAFLMQKAKPRSDPESLAGNWTRDQRAVMQARLGSLTLQRLLIEPQWEQKALCRKLFSQADGMENKTAIAEVFFPPGTEGPSRDQEEVAKKVCRACPVVASCLQWALDTGQQEGVFGGKTPQERRNYRNLKPRVDALQANPARARTNAEISELLEDVAIQKRTVISRPAKDLQKQG